ncbi:response regulator [Candidatus Saccharibacteria bacterium]|nr:response regulator [Candidatus Saccharibacteria bacterium]
MEIKKKILLVEDDQSLAEVYRSRLEMEGFEVVTVHDGEVAVSEVINHRPDLIILDAMLPKISGFDLLDIIRGTPEVMNVRVIMLTALSQSSDRERAESLGADDYLVKTQITIGDVVNSVRKHLDIPS